MSNFVRLYVEELESRLTPADLIAHMPAIIGPTTPPQWSREAFPDISKEAFDAVMAVPPSPIYALNSGWEEAVAQMLDSHPQVPQGFLIPPGSTIRAHNADGTFTEIHFVDGGRYDPYTQSIVEEFEVGMQFVEAPQRREDVVILPFQFLPPATLDAQASDPWDYDAALIAAEGPSWVETAWMI